VSENNERTETFEVTGPLHASVTTRSGDIAVRTGEATELRVRLRADSSKYEHLLESAQVLFNPESNQLDVRTQPRDHDGSSKGRGGKLKVSWFDFGGSDLDVMVVLPAGSSLEVKTVSGDVALQGPLDSVGVSSVSGDVDVTDPCDTLDVRTTSGDVNVGGVRRTLKCRSASGDVACLSAATATELTSASGDVDLAISQPGQLVIKAVSGDVHVRVARGLVVDVNANSVSGELGSNIDFDKTSDLPGDEVQVYVKVTTVSGDIRIDKTS
jgi:DUF4097 and DUF4098 domain-containing protein YvlB